MTFFTDALFRQALSTEATLAGAFARAHALVSARERAEGLSPPSDPQLFVGDAIAAKLKTLERPASAESAERTMRAAIAGLFANLVAGARLAIFLRVPRQAFRIDAAQLVLAFIVSALIDNAADWVRHGPDATLDWSAPAEFAALALLVTVAALLAWLFREAPLLLALPIVALVSLPLVQIVNVAPTLLAGAEESRAQSRPASGISSSRGSVPCCGEVQLR